MRLYDIDLTEEEYYSYYIHEDDDNVDITFQDTEIMISSEAFNRLKEEIIGNEEGLARVEPNVATDEDKTPKRETLLKELIETIDKIEALDKESEELYEKEFAVLIAEKPYPSQREVFEIKQKGQHIIRKMEKLKYYKEKLEAQLKYGELQ